MAVYDSDGLAGMSWEGVLGWPTPVRGARKGDSAENDYRVNGLERHTRERLNRSAFRPRHESLRENCIVVQLKRKELAFHLFALSQPIVLAAVLSAESESPGLNSRCLSEQSRRATSVARR